MLPLCMCLEEVNDLPSEQFIKIFGNVVEHTPAAAICILKKRPFHNVEAICDAIDAYLDSLSEHESKNIVQLHPDLAGKLADTGKLSFESTYEQTSMGLLSLSSENKHKLTLLNEEYKARFGFPFVVCIRDTNGINEIIRAIQHRLNNEIDEEINTVIDEVKKISRLRILAMVKE
ncbi:hypothetical protein RN001_002845 [Aquatica leii]|uniref:2-oxo-4-hydroxy-4-carboxy-5-ureidoimidazoline decarboxylase n=1 Tax=Aquatica leii TaxID=1421715 RepID=A0AAN7SM08_9COLE|nr:hypothetical protein RN001_002845 [Aquatica leii]